jgi:mono/diheme cytochrome c family protein
MYARKLYGIVAALVVLAVFAMAQQPAPTQEKVIKHVPVKQTNPASGQEMYTSYCAVCHGADGTGNGPAASALKVPPTDLTTLAPKNGGTYPALQVSTVLRGDVDLPAHGSEDMPVWGRLFRSMSQGHNSEVQQRIANLNQYVESLQKKQEQPDRLVWAGPASLSLAEECALPKHAHFFRLDGW